MNPFKKSKKNVNNNTIKVFRQEQKKLEDTIYKAHNDVMTNVVIPAAKDFAALNKPESNCKNGEPYVGVFPPDITVKLRSFPEQNYKLKLKICT